MKKLGVMMLSVVALPVVVVGAVAVGVCAGVLWALEPDDPSPIMRMKPSKRGPTTRWFPYTK